MPRTSGWSSSMSGNDSAPKLATPPAARIVPLAVATSAISSGVRVTAASEADRSDRWTSRDGSMTGKSFTTIAWNAVKTAVADPMPSASTATADRENAACSRSERVARRKSSMTRPAGPLRPSAPRPGPERSLARSPRRRSRTDRYRRESRVDSSAYQREREAPGGRACHSSIRSPTILRPRTSSGRATEISHVNTRAGRA